MSSHSVSRGPVMPDGASLRAPRDGMAGPEIYGRP